MTLADEHVKDLQASGLHRETIEGAGIYSELPDNVNTILGWNAPVRSLLAFPYPGTSFTRWKLFPGLKQGNGHSMKYFQKKGSPIELYKPPGFDEGAGIIRITEGEKKALKGAQEGLNVCGIGGIWNYAAKDNNGQPQLIEPLSEIRWDGKRIEIIPDGDFQTKAEVCHAVYRMGKMLQKRGANVSVVQLPAEEKLDDYLVRNSVNAFLKLPRLTLDDELFLSAVKKEPLDIENCTLDFTTFIKMKVPERPRLFSWLPAGGLVMVYGPRGIGKTFFSLSLACALAEGRPFLKWNCAAPTGCVVVDGEMPLATLQERLMVFCGNFEIPKKPLCVLSGEHVYLKTEKDLCLTDPVTQENFLRFLDKKGDIGAVIIDNVSCLFTGLRESDKQDWEKVVPYLLAMRRRGIAVIIVHHAGKSGDQRGTSGREDLLDTVIKLEPVVGHENEGARFVVRFAKCRCVCGEEVEPIEATLDLKVTGAWLWKPFRESTFERMVELAGAGIEIVSDMAAELGITKGAVCQLKKKGIDKGVFLPSRKIILAGSGKD